MRGIFCGTQAATNEEYKEVLKRKNIWLVVFTLTGAAAAVTAFFASKQGVPLSDRILSVYCGVGTGIAAGCLILLVKNLLLMKNEKKLKESRMERSDERLREIHQKAIEIAVKALLLSVIAGGLIGGIFYPVLIKALLAVMWVFLLSYLAAYAVLKRKM